MKIVIASDHAGFSLKEALVQFLRSQQKFEVIDLGVDSDKPVDYPDLAKRASEMVSRGDASFGVLVCGSGIGMCMVANRFRHVRAVVINDSFDAEMSRKHNNANVACFGGRRMDILKAQKLLSTWLREAFEGGRHERRVEKIEI